MDIDLRLTPLVADALNAGFRFLESATDVPLVVLDDTAGVLSASEAKSLFAGFSTYLVDPASAQLRKLKRQADAPTRELYEAEPQKMLEIMAKTGCVPA